MSQPNNWSIAFAKQALADFESWQVLSQLKHDTDRSVPQSQALHFLQMACEKLAKAHLCRRPKANPFEYQASHAYIAGTLPTIVEHTLQKRLPNASIALIRQRRKQAQHLFREIELLHPQVDDNGQRPDNCEYPWSDDSGSVRVPAEHRFEALRLADKQGGPELLKIVEDAIRSLC